MKQNCWEHKGCGREPGGAKAGELGICPATEETRLDGIHEGRNAGRACWSVAGTLCEGEVQGTFAIKYAKCEECDFYRLVKKEEQGSYKMSIVLLNKLKAFG